MTVGIVGGGITGLALQHYLSAEGVESVVFDAASEPGGVIDSRRVEGRVLDFGPQRTRLSPPLDSLVDSLGLRDELREADDGPLYVYRDGARRRVPFTPREAVETDLLSWRGKLRLLAEPLTGPPRDQETIETFLTRTLGREAAQYLVGPLYAGVYASHPDEMRVKHSFGRALDAHDVSGSLLVAAAKAALRGADLPPAVTFDDGMQTLPEALYAAHRDRVHLDTPVEAVRDAAEGFRLETPSRSVPVSTVILTTPAATTAGLLDSVAPETAQALAQLTYNSLVVVHLAAEATLDGAGHQVQYDEDYRTLGVTYNASLFGRDGVYTCYLGGSRYPDLLDESTATLRRLAESEFREMTGVDARALTVRRRPNVMPAYDTSWDALDDVATPPGIHLCANYESRAGLPGRVRQAKGVATRVAAVATGDRMAV
ncbi:oxygen-dependent protoporphyrinogen oxidase [Haloplanus vescus]|uniref:Oxygen-dependent protoporphyrinogen oxidase n=1 Tax=Haloplanus vescus TaxID=555874 RepID=A0A1H3W8I9_9EURY|nr:protoporphyrinogen oxidase [Haloplanus vescus]SDZ83449.1 oxygen-dependent protoporphyrinogen oxidase [Haloplanus vescus]